MIQTLEPKTRTSPARRRSSAPLPVLISIPNIANCSRSPRGRVRRRLRREVRVVGYALLILLPLSMALATFAGERRTTRVPQLVIEPPASSVEAVSLQAPVALTTIEPAGTIDRPTETTEVLPALMLPVDVPEEPSDGGH